MPELLFVQSFCDTENFWRSMFKPSLLQYLFVSYIEKFVADQVGISALIVIYFFELRKEKILARSLLRDSVNVKTKITTTQKSIEGFNDTKIDS